MKQHLLAPLCILILFFGLSCKNQNNKNQETTQSETEEEIQSSPLPYTSLFELPDETFHTEYNSSYQETSDNAFHSYKRYDSDQWILLKHQHSGNPELSIFEDWVLADAVTKKVLMIQEQDFWVENLNSEEETKYHLKAQIIDFSDKEPIADMAESVFTEFLEKGDIDATFLEMRENMEETTAPLNANEWEEMSKAALNNTLVKTWVKDVNIREEPNLKSETIGTVPEGTVLAWTGKKSETTNSIELRGKEFTDYWYELESIQNENSATGWIFGGALIIPGQDNDEKNIAKNEALDLPHFGKFNLSTWKKESARTLEEGDMESTVQPYSKGDQILEIDKYDVGEYGLGVYHTLFDKNKKELKKRTLSFERGERKLTEAVTDFIVNPPKTYTRSQILEDANPWEHKDLPTSVKGDWKISEAESKSVAKTDSKKTPAELVSKVEKKPIPKKGNFKIQLGVFSERKSLNYIAKHFGLSESEKAGLKKELSHDFIKIDGKVCRRYFYGAFETKADADTKKKELEAKSNMKFTVVRN